MPSGKTHDTVTLLLSAPAFSVAYFASNDLRIASLIAAGFLFGGLMFGPDLDTASRQYSRWGYLRVLWFPYRRFFRHRSRWSHGLIFGAFLRVVYFFGVLTCAAFLIAYGATILSGGNLPGILDFARVWARLRLFSNWMFGDDGVLFAFAGIWAGAASHTFTDLAGTYVKTGRKRL